MSLEVSPFRPVDALLLDAQGVQAAQRGAIGTVDASFPQLGVWPHVALTVRAGTHILGCGGIVQVTPRMGLIWALLAEDAGRRMVALHRICKRMVESSRARRLEATVPEGFGEGCRFVELLGFEFEGRMPAYGMNDETHLRYGRVRA